MARTPLGSVALTEWHDGDATNKCVNVMTVYENRSDTAVISITQNFQTLHTPKHADATAWDWDWDQNWNLRGGAGQDDLPQAAQGKGRISIGGTRTGHYSLSVKQQAPRQAEA
ncbi:hypothetical protein ACFVTY_20760 [Streptomyces sp. NPDC058067]|uniref:hypothetical protein n=1 Tax=Streptomyces sp. NPDC058067 TaxID=3346324 RepID=UPI0036E0AC8A